MNQEELNDFNKRIDSLKAMVNMTNEDGSAYFDVDYIIQNVLRLTPKELAENKNFHNKPNDSNQFEF
jgi:hypothetical protein